MTMEQQLDELARLEYPKKVDVVDKVMAEVGQKPYLRPVHKPIRWQRIATIAAAAVIGLVAVNVVLFNSGTTDNASQGISVPSDNTWTTVEDEALDTNKTVTPTT